MPEVSTATRGGGMHLNLDGSWDAGVGDLESVNAIEWGPKLRFTAPGRLVEEFFREYASRLSAFTLYGSGDFHYLSALWLRQATEPFTLVSFDNHPDWDVRPPRWACGGWINRALELPMVEKAVIWGCGNFECWWPGQMFGNLRAERAGKIELHIWGDSRPPRKRERRGVMFRTSWRAKFSESLKQMAGRAVYITIDLDCLRSEDAITNWENGLFEVDDLEWALAELQASARVIGGDVCGAFSVPKYARATQRFVAEWDHPDLPKPDLGRAREINARTLARLWPLLTQRHKNNASGDQH